MRITEVTKTLLNKESKIRNINISLGENNENLLGF